MLLPRSLYKKLIAQYAKVGHADIRAPLDAIVSLGIQAFLYHQGILIITYYECSLLPPPPPLESAKKRHETPMFNTSLYVLAAIFRAISRKRVI